MSGLVLREVLSSGFLRIEARIGQSFILSSPVKQHNISFAMCVCAVCVRAPKMTLYVHHEFPCTCAAEDMFTGVMIDLWNHRAFSP